MKSYRFLTGPLLLGIGAWLTGPELRGQEELPPERPPAAATVADPEFNPEFEAADIAGVEAEEPEALLSGPLHEAFAEPVQMDPEPTAVIPQQPPEPIDELIPEEQPDQEGVIWLPGYWAWEPTREDFVWVSGVWRLPPPDREWVPGYWTETDGGYQWVSGFWSPIERREVEYLPPPPESLENGPSSPQPDDSHTWVSGCWNYHDSHYVWRPGYWTPYQTNWIWTPDQYVWTPRGVVFVNGYWDYSFAGRGSLYSPVYIPSSYYATRPYSYRPRVVLNAARLLVHMFVYPRNRHYFYGDYYAPFYRDRGFYTWSGYYSRGYDPLLSYYQWHYGRRGINYVDRLNRWNRYYTRYEALRPPRTYKAFNRLAVGGQHSQLHREMARDIRDLQRNDEQWARKFRRISREQQQQYKQIADLRKDLRRHRRETEGRDERAQTRVKADARVEPIGRLNLPDDEAYRTAVRNVNRQAPPRPDRDRRDDDRGNRTADRDRDQQRNRDRDQGQDRDRDRDRDRDGEQRALRPSADEDGNRADRDRADRDRAARNRDNQDREQRDRAERNRDTQERAQRDRDRGGGSGEGGERRRGQGGGGGGERNRDGDRSGGEGRNGNRGNRANFESSERPNVERRTVEVPDVDRSELRTRERRTEGQPNFDRPQRVQRPQVVEPNNQAVRDSERRGNSEFRGNVERPRREFNVPERSITRDVPRNFDRPQVDRGQLDRPQFERGNRDFRGPSMDRGDRPGRSDRPGRGGGNGGGRRGFDLGQASSSPEVSRPRVNVDVPEGGSPVSIERPRRERPQRAERNNGGRNSAEEQEDQN